MPLQSSLFSGQYVQLLKDLNAFLPAKATGWIRVNKAQRRIPDSELIPEYVFYPETNTDLTFLVFASEVDAITNDDCRC